MGMRYFELFESELPMDQESRMARAKQMGFNTRAYHGTNSDIDEFSLDKTKTNIMTGHGFHFADNSKEASGYAKQLKGAGRNVLPVLLRIRKAFVVGIDAQNYDNYKWINNTYEELGKSANLSGSIWDQNNQKIIWKMVYDKLEGMGYDCIYWEKTPADFMKGHYNKIVMFNPKNIRSIFAKFDPSKSNSANIND
jgi:hypothetical protein